MFFKKRGEVVSKETVLAWQIYNRDFTDGDWVVVEDFDGDFYHGKLKTVEEGIVLVRPNGVKSHTVPWDDIVFMANDGFPVKELPHMTYNEAVLRASTLDTELVRAFLQKEVSKNLAMRKKRKKDQSDESHRSDDSHRSMSSSSIRSCRRSFGGGCPFYFEDVIIKDLINPGNNSWDHWGRDDEELLILESKDGAIMHSFDMDHLFVFDGLKLA